SGGDSFPSRVAMRSRPGRSVTSMRPSGRKASPHGFDRPRATVSTWRSPAEERNVCAIDGLVMSSSASAATGDLMTGSRVSKGHNRSRPARFRHVHNDHVSVTAEWIYAIVLETKTQRETRREEFHGKIAGSRPMRHRVADGRRCRGGLSVAAGD